MKLLDFINEKTDNAYKNFKLVSVIFDEKTRDTTFKFLYKDNLREHDKDKLYKLIVEYLNADVNVIIKCKKAYVEESLVVDVIYNFISKNYASVGAYLCKQDIFVNIGENIEVIINCNDFAFNYLNSSSVLKELNDYGESFFFEPFSLSLNNVKPPIVDNIDEYENSFISQIDLNSKENNFKYIKVKDVNNIIGEVNGSPIEISSINSPLENVEICGKIKFLNQKSFESKRKDKEGNALERIYYSFVLADNSSKINCVIFPNKADLSKMSHFNDDDFVVLHGSVEDFNGRFSFKVNSMAFAQIINEETVEEIVEMKKEPNKEYRFAFPEPYFDMMQDNFFAKKEEVGQYLLDNDVVVFDIETTGLEVSRCEIIEIGAIKLHKGQKIETFETFVRPSGIIPDEITDLTGITFDMVKDSPPIEYIIADFYKFCYGCTIIAYNIDFDFKFINQFGKKYGWLFDNKQIDALYLARAFVPGLKNFKLSTVCKKLDVSLENAHRAVHDAMATADVVIKLSPNIA